MRRLRGFSLVELMIALVLGLLVIAGVASVLLTNRQSYRSNTALSQVQDSSRIAFEFLARSIRQAGLTGCGNSFIANVLDTNDDGVVDGADAWWANFDNALNGYEEDENDPAVTTGTATAQRVAGTDSIQVIGVSDNGLSVNDHTGTTITLNDAAADLSAGDVIVICDFDHATILQIATFNPGTSTLTFGSGGSSPLNCSTDLKFPTDCASAAGSKFTRNSQVARLSATSWYIGNNPQGGRSLYQMTLRNNSGTPTPVAQETVRDVTAMQIQYLFGGAYVDADAVTDWTTVSAVRLNLSIRGDESNSGTDGQPITRQFGTTITLRNRVN